jgi:hypothetical protein
MRLSITLPDDIAAIIRRTAKAERLSESLVARRFIEQGIGLHGQDASRLLESLGKACSPEELKKRQETARKRLDQIR